MLQSWQRFNMAIFSSIYNIGKTKILPPIICKHASFTVWQGCYVLLILLRKTYEA